MKTFFFLSICLHSCLGYDLIVSGYNTNLSIFQISNDDYHLLGEQYLKAALNMSWLNIEKDDGDGRMFAIVAVQEVALIF